jgi:hypothetical protein
MNFEERIKTLCEEAIACKCEEDAVAVARQIQLLMHSRIEELRANINHLQLLGDVATAK